MKINLNSQAYQSPSKDINNQRCVNMYPTAAGPEGMGTMPLLPTPGLKELVDLGGNEVRALMGFDDKVYAIVDNTVYVLTLDLNAETATGASIGTISTSTGFISWARNPTQIMIVDGSGSGHIITAATDTLTQISDTDFTGGGTVVFADSYFVYNTPDAATMYVTAINDGSTISALDVATAEGRPDKTIGIAIDKRELWVFGEASVEIWFNAANAAGFPFSRREGAYIDQGCAAAGSILNFDNGLIWLDDRGYVVRANGYTLIIVSTDAINSEISDYNVISDAISYSHTHQGHLFYIITFPTEGKTWAYDATTGLWHERAHFGADDVLTRHLSNCYLRSNRLDFVGSFNSGKVMLMKADYYDDAGDAIHRLWYSPHYNVEYKQIGVDSLEMQLESGKGLVTGTGSDPHIMMRYSADGGYTFSNELARSTGKVGEYSKRVRWNRLGTSREWLFEFRITDPIKLASVEAVIELSGGTA